MNEILNDDENIIEPSPNAVPEAVWDPINGVWKGAVMPVSHDELVGPLYIFGYGSLIWRPGDVLIDFEAYYCKCIGWSRRYCRTMSYANAFILRELILFCYQ